MPQAVDADGRTRERPPGAAGGYQVVGHARADAPLRQPGIAISVLERNGMQPDVRMAMAGFEKAAATAKETRILAWSHIYLGRLYDVVPDRQKALAEYQAALTVRDSLPDTKAAAEKGLKQPFTNPNGPAAKPQEEPLDPSGKAEKQAYRPPSN